MDIIQLIKILSWIVIVIPVFNYVDWRITRNGGKPMYGVINTIKTVAVIVWGAMFTHYDGTQNGKEILYQIIPIVLYCALSFWIVYELIRNSWTKRKWDYYDQMEGDSGSIDRFFKGVGSRYFHIFVKVCALVITVLAAIKLYHA